MVPFDTKSPFVTSAVVEIAKDSWGRIWTTIYVGYLAEGGVAYWNGSQWNDFDHSDGVAGPNVKGLAIDNQNNVWVATTTGVSKIIPTPSWNNTMEKPFYIFPNPVKSNLSVSGEYDYISIMDNLGREYILEKSISNNYDLSRFSSGIYYVKLSNDQLTYTSSILIE